MSHSGICASNSSEIRLNGQINQKLHWLNQKINYRDYTTMTVNKRLPMNGRLNGERLIDASPTIVWFQLSWVNCSECLWKVGCTLVYRPWSTFWLSRPVKFGRGNIVQ